MVLSATAFFGADIQKLGRWRPRATGSGAARRRSDSGDRRYVDRLLQDFDGGAFRIGWDAGNGAAGPALEKLAASCRASITALHRRRQPLPQPPSRSDRGEQSRRSEGAGRRQGPRFRHRLRRRRRPDRRVDGEGRVVWGDQLLAILAEPVLARLPGATIIADVKASQALFDRIAELGGTP
jgi:phosphomannomutase